VARSSWTRRIHNDAHSFPATWDFSVASVAVGKHVVYSVRLGRLATSAALLTSVGATGPRLRASRSDIGDGDCLWRPAPSNSQQWTLKHWAELLFLRKAWFVTKISPCCGDLAPSRSRAGNDTGKPALAAGHLSRALPANELPE